MKLRVDAPGSDKALLANLGRTRLCVCDTSRPARNVHQFSAQSNGSRPRARTPLTSAETVLSVRTTVFRLRADP